MKLKKSILDSNREILNPRSGTSNLTHHRGMCTGRWGGGGCNRASPLDFFAVLQYDVLYKMRHIYYGMRRCWGPV